MSAFLRKYATGTGADVYIPIVKRDAVDFAVSGDWTPAAGDVKVSIDGGTAANIGTLPVAVTMGNTAMWKFVFTNAELTGKSIAVTVADSATKAVEDQMFVVETYGNASARHPFDLGTASTAQTGDAYARLGAPAGASVSADIAALPTAAENADAVWDEARSGHTTTGTFGGDAVDAPPNFDALAIDASGNLTGSVASVTGAVGSVTAGVTVTTNNDKTGYTLSNTGIDALFTRQLTESYATDGSAPTVAQALMQIQQMLTEFAISGTTLTVKKLDGSTTAMTFTLDSSTVPTSVTRAS